MDDILILIECDKCDHQQYFEPDWLPGGVEHCLYCENCMAKLPRQPNNKILAELLPLQFMR